MQGTDELSLLLGTLDLLVLKTLSWGPSPWDGYAEAVFETLHAGPGRA